MIFNLNLVSLVCSVARKVIKLIKDGNVTNVHGAKKVNNPAVKAVIKVTLSIINKL